METNKSTTLRPFLSDLPSAVPQFEYIVLSNHSFHRNRSIPECPSIQRKLKVKYVILPTCSVPLFMESVFIISLHTNPSPPGTIISLCK